MCSSDLTPVSGETVENYHPTRLAVRLAYLITMPNESCGEIGCFKYVKTFSKHSFKEVEMIKY